MENIVLELKYSRDKIFWRWTEEKDGHVWDLIYRLERLRTEVDIMKGKILQAEQK